MRQVGGGRDAGQRRGAKGESASGWYSASGAECGVPQRGGAERAVVGIVGRTHRGRAPRGRAHAGKTQAERTSTVRRGGIHRPCQRSDLTLTVQEVEEQVQEVPED